MAFAQSFYNQSSVLSISVMVVDDDPGFLQIMSRMLEKSKYRDPSTMEVRVMAVKDSMEALSTLKIQRHNVDLVITDYYMPGMNGVQLKLEITREFGNLPVIVMSSDTNKEHESLTCGALCFISKPIKAIDLTKIYQLALTCKKNNKSILWTENNHKKKDVSIPKQIQLLPDQTDDSLKTKEKNCLSRSDSRTLNIANETCVSTDRSPKFLKRKSHGGSGDDVSKKKSISWTDFLNDRFLQAIMHIGVDKVTPKNILEFMNIPYLTREQVASHLQKYRIFLRKVVEKGLNHTSAWSTRVIESNPPYAQFKELYNNNLKPSNSWYDTSLNNRSFYSKSIQGFRQSRLLSNTHEPVRDKHIPYNYMNRSPTNEPHIGSTLTLPIKNKFKISNQHEPPMMANKISQTSQVRELGQHGLPSINGNNFNINWKSSCGSSTFNQRGLSSYESLTFNQPELSSYRSSTPNQPKLNGCGSSTLNRQELSNYRSLTSNKLGPNDYYGSPIVYQPGHNIFGSSTPNLEIPQLENLSLYDDLDKPDEFPCNISNFHFDQNKRQGEAASTTKFDLSANFSTELDHIFSLKEDNDLTVVNMNQDHSNGEMPNTFTASEKNSTMFSMNPNRNQNQEQDFMDWSLLDPQNLVDDNFMDLFNSNMTRTGLLQDVLQTNVKK